MNRNRQIDYEGLQQLVEFQVKNGVKGILAVGTTGESPTLDWNEHNKVIEKTHEYARQRLTIAGTGSNSTQETIEGTAHAHNAGIKAVLLVDPYYNGPSSLEIRKEYVEPIASRFPEIQMIPYVIPGRTGTQLLPQDIATLHSAVSQRALCQGSHRRPEKHGVNTAGFAEQTLTSLSGDDDKTYTMMISPDIQASGVISVVSNVAPSAVSDMVHYLLGRQRRSRSSNPASAAATLQLITVKTTEQTPYGPVACKARNPLAYKTLMNVLGYARWTLQTTSGQNDPPRLRSRTCNARKVYEANPEISSPSQILRRRPKGPLNNEKYLEGLYYA